MHPGHFAMDQMYVLQMNDHQFCFVFVPLRHMEQKLVTVLPWIWVLIIYQTKDTFQEYGIKG